MNAILIHFLSAAHLFGTRPFDSTIYPVESWFVAALAAGEGWHNYHHACEYTRHNFEN